MPFHTSLAIPDIKRASLKQLIEKNVVEFLTWGFVNANGWTQVEVRTPGTADPYDDESLYPVQKDGVVDGRYWQSRHPGWVYEDGLDNASPTIASAVTINGTLYPTASTTGTYAHTIDFARGRIVFDTAIATTAVVQAAYAYRYVGVYSQDVAWFRPVVLDGFLTEQSQGRGVLAVLDDYRVVTPLVVVEVPLRARSVGKELGSSIKRWGQDVLFHVLAARKADRDNVVDAIATMKDRTILLFDPDARAEDGDYPLDSRGVRRIGASDYPDLLLPPPQGYLRTSGFWTRMTGQDVDERLPLFRGVIRGTLEVDFA